MTSSAHEQLGPSDAVVAVDVQRCFCPGGALAVDQGDQVVPVLNAWIEAARNAGATVVASRDWHPSDHCSFEAQGGAWPPHCVAGTPEAEFHPRLDLPRETILISKGRDPQQEQYSAFHDTRLAEELRRRGVKRVWIGGLALDVCVLHSVLDAVEAGFEVHLIRPATRAVEAESGDARRAIDQMREAGAIIEDA